MTHKLSSQQLEEITAITAKFDAAIRQYGELHLQKRLIDVRIEEVENLFGQLEKEREGISTKLQKEYGYTGTINLTTGEFLADPRT